jgi:hypothetical protein
MVAAPPADLETIKKTLHEIINDNDDQPVFKQLYHLLSKEFRLVRLR